MIAQPPVDAASIARADVEDFLFHEAALLDRWQLDAWLALLTEDASYRVPANDSPDADAADTLFLIADDIHRIRARVARLNDRNAHAEYPHSRTRRLITNVRIVARHASTIDVESNFIVYRFRRDEQVRVYVGRYRHVLRVGPAGEAPGLRIAARTAILDAMELGSLGSVSFVL